MTLIQAQEALDAETMSQDEFDAFVARRQAIRRAITVGAMLLVVVLLVSFAFCGRGKKATVQQPPTDPPVKTSELKAESNRLEAEVNRLGSKVTALESKPDKVGASTSSLKVLDRKVEKLNGEVGGFGSRILDLEEKAARPPAPPPQSTSEPEPEEELTDEQLAEQYRQAVRRGRLPD